MPNPRKPDHLKAISGTDQPCRRDPLADILPDYPKVEEFPGPPPNLNVDGAAMWNALGPQLVAVGLLQVVDLYALEHMCYLWQQFRQKASAKLEITASESNALKACWSDFGLTPAARRRVVAAAGDAPSKNRFAQHGRRSRTA